MKLLQHGSSASIYRTVHRTNAGNIDAALKVFNNENDNQKDEARNEIEILRHLQDGLPTCNFIIDLLFEHEMVSRDEVPSITLELCHRGDLYSLMMSGKLCLEDVTHYAAELVLALDHLSSLCILHGDVKPENIGITATGHIRLLDFGVAKVLKDDEDVTHGAGTLFYASPEVLCRDAVTCAADWWSMGGIMFELLFHDAPFSGVTIEEIVSKIVTGEPDWPEVCPANADMIAFVASLLTKSPKERLRSADACKTFPFFEEVDWESVASETWSPSWLVC